MWVARLMRWTDPTGRPTTFRVIDSLAGRVDDVDRSRRACRRRPRRPLMRRYYIGDLRTEAYLLKVEEALAEARASSARRALLRDASPPRRRAQVWLGSVLLAAGHRLLGESPTIRALLPDLESSRFAD